MAKVLVVDDDPDFVKVTAKILEKAGYEVASASNGAKALQTMRSDPPDVVLLDIMMENNIVPDGEKPDFIEIRRYFQECSRL